MFRKEKLESEEDQDFINIKEELKNYDNQEKTIKGIATNKSKSKKRIEFQIKKQSIKNMFIKNRASGYKL